MGPRECAKVGQGLLDQVLVFRAEKRKEALEEDVLPREVRTLRGPGGGSCAQGKRWKLGHYEAQSTECIRDHMHEFLFGSGQLNRACPGGPL